MKKQSVLLLALFIGLCAAPDLSARPERGYMRDEHGRLLVFRKQPSWFCIPIGAIMTAGGAVGVFAVWAEKISVGSHTSLHLKTGPFHTHIDGGYSENTTKDRVLASLGFGLISVGGIALLYDWHYHYSRLDEPYVILDRNGMWFEGHGQLNWRDLKGVRLVEEPIRDSKGRVIGTRLLIEVVEIQKRWRIEDSRLNITREALYDFILEYCEAATGKNPRIT